VVHQCAQGRGQAAEAPRHAATRPATDGRIYEAYEEACQRAGLVDFAELLLRSLRAAARHAGAAATTTSARFGHVLVDEFQDTNAIQYAGCACWPGATGVFAVGDDDQSIYRWRGARSRTCSSSGATSDARQLVAARAELPLDRQHPRRRQRADRANNSGRSARSCGPTAKARRADRLYAAYNEIDEARYVVEQDPRMDRARRQARRQRDPVSLQRPVARLRRRAAGRPRMPYRVYGGLRFFERAEIKDALAYLRLISNRDDDASFERVVNLPARGIGDRTLDGAAGALAPRAKIHVAVGVRMQRDLGAKASRCAAGLPDADRETRRRDAGPAAARAGRSRDPGSGLVGHYQKEKADKGEARLENLDELVSAARDFEPEDTDMPPLMAFLSHAVLESGEGQAEARGKTACR
jgi:DNA helicase II / ATP-dependent DNA helicase PcrA